MTKLPHQDEQQINMPLEGRRDRSYSDAHALIYSSKTNSSHSNSPVDNTIIGAETINSRSNTPTSHKKNKHHSQHSRPRSKSLDLHRHHSTPVHKKKQYPQHHKHIPDHRNGRISSSSSPKFEGRLWIRPACATKMPFFPTLSRVAPSPLSSKEQIENHGGFADMTSLNDPAQTRQVTDGSFNDEMYMYTSPNSSFDSYQQRQAGIGNPARIIFGESGKPIKPRSDCF